MSETSQSTERLRELLLDLEQSQRRERELLAQSEALLAGVRALTEASTPDELFGRILEALRQPLSFDDAFVLRKSRESGVLVATSATHPLLVGTSWSIGKAFARVLQGGRVVVHLDTTVFGEWQAQPEEVRKLAGSAICIPLRGTAETALLVCTRLQAKGFQPAHEQMAKRFQPLATQALRDIERVAQIERANRDMRLVLDSVDQGLLTLDRDGRIVGETSGAVHAWFGAFEPGATFHALIARVHPVSAETFELGWQQIVDGFLPLDVAIDTMPSRIQAGGRTLAVQLRPIGDGELWTRMLVVVSDVTEALERERAEEGRRELAAVVTRIFRDRAGFQAFWEEATGMTARLFAPEGSPDRSTQIRLLHTLKGTAASVGLGSVARACHGIEEEARAGALTSASFIPLAERWRALAHDIAPLLGAPAQTIAITEEEHRGLMHELRRLGAPSEISNRVGAWTEERLEVPLARLADDARGIAERLGKPEIDVRIEHQGLRIDASSYRPFFGALIHAIRNAVDHGLEPGEVREATGKPRTGSLVLRGRRTEDALEISIEDDGRGIDWSKVAEQAAALGVAHEAHDDLVEALLTDGLSTSEEVTETSGRGVGMGALRASVEALGGTIAIESALTRGTTVRCTFPPGPIRRDESQA